MFLQDCLVDLTIADRGGSKWRSYRTGDGRTSLKVELDHTGLGHCVGVHHVVDDEVVGLRVGVAVLRLRLFVRHDESPGTLRMDDDA